MLGFEHKLTKNMEFQGLRLEYSLEGASNFRTWRERMFVVLKDQEVKNFVKKLMAQPQDPQQLAQHNKRDVRARRIIP